MNLLESTAQRVFDSLDASAGSAPRHKGARRVAYLAGGFALLTAASAGVSSLRERLEAARDSDDRQSVVATRT